MEPSRAEQIRERLDATARFARSLEGQPVEEAFQRATEAGFEPVIIRDPHPPLTADLRIKRVRLHVDADDRVVVAAPG